MGTSISYCPQEFYGIANFDHPDEDEQIKIVSQYEAEVNVFFFGVLAKEIPNMYKENKNGQIVYEKTIGKEYGKKWTDLSKEELLFF